MGLSHPESIRYWAICAVFLFFKMFANTVVQFVAKRRDKVASLPEDKIFFGVKGVRAESESDLYSRGAGCWENDLENIPIFLILGLAFVGLGGEPRACLWMFTVFCVARALHTLFYVKALQPHRAIAYVTGLLVTLVLCLGIVALATFA